MGRLANMRDKTITFIAGFCTGWVVGGSRLTLHIAYTIAIISLIVAHFYFA